jgi:hypothetical protein
MKYVLKPILNLIAFLLYVLGYPILLICSLIIDSWEFKLNATSDLNEIYYDGLVDNIKQKGFWGYLNDPSIPEN